MSIAAFIRESVLRPRLQRAGCMVVYDPQRRYRALCRSLAAEGVVVVDASDNSIESREAASQALIALGQAENGLRELLVYVPAAPPLTDEQRQGDPFSVYAACGAMFPAGDGDDYLSLCLKAKPDHGTEIRRLFEQEALPSFDLIDNVGGGLKWPTLRTALQRIRVRFADRAAICLFECPPGARSSAASGRGSLRAPSQRYALEAGLYRSRRTD